MVARSLTRLEALAIPFLTTQDLKKRGRTEGESERPAENQRKLDSVRS